LTRAGEAVEQTEVHISSLVDVWLLVRNIESNGERNRILHVLKSRGMAHSNLISEFEITNCSGVMQDWKTRQHRNYRIISVID